MANPEFAASRSVVSSIIGNSAGEIVAAGINDDEPRTASLTDTRMKYGSVNRGGHG